MALAAIVLGAISIIVGFLPVPFGLDFIVPIVGIIVGVKAKKQLSAAGEPSGMAMAGIIMSIAGLLITIGYFIYVIFLIAEQM